MGRRPGEADGPLPWNPSPRRGVEEPVIADDPIIPEPVTERDRMPRWVLRGIILFFGAYLALQVGTWLFDKLQGVIVLLVISLFLALAVEPGVNSLARRGWRRGSATAVVLFGVVFAVLVFIFAIGALLVRQVANLIDQAPEYIEELETFINDTFSTNLDSDAIIADLTADGGPVQDLAQQLAGNTLAVTGRVLGVVLQALSIGLFTFYLVADGPRLRRTVCSVLPADRQRQVLRAWEVSIDKIGGYLYSRALLALLSTVASTVAFALLSVDYPLALGLWVGLVSQFLPVIGTYLAGTLPVLVALVEAPVQALWVLVFILLYQQVENYLFSPRITARTMELHPAIAFGAAIAGVAVLGPIGGILALPGAAIIQAFVSYAIPRYRVVEDTLTDDVRPKPRRPRLVRRLAARRLAAENEQPPPGAPRPEPGTAD